MHEPITDTGLVDIARLWIIHFESVVSAVPIGCINKLTVKLEDMIHECKLKLRYIFAFLLIPQKLVPGCK